MRASFGTSARWAWLGPKQAAIGGFQKLVIKTRAGSQAQLGLGYFRSRPVFRIRLPVWQLEQRSVLLVSGEFTFDTRIN